MNITGERTGGAGGADSTAPNEAVLLGATDTRLDDDRTRVLASQEAAAVRSDFGDRLTMQEFFPDADEETALLALIGARNAERVRTAKRGDYLPPVERRYLADFFGLPWAPALSRALYLAIRRQPRPQQASHDGTAQFA